MYVHDSLMTTTSQEEMGSKLCLMRFSCGDTAIAVILICCSENLKNTFTVRTEYQADFIEWHPSGALLVVLNNKGELQVSVGTW